MTIKKLIIAAALAAPAMMTASQAHAQVAGIATVDQLRAVVATKAFAAAFNQINTNFKSQLDQAAARRRAEQTELAPLIAAIDTNKDQQLSQEEVTTAQTAKNPAIARIQTAQQNADRDVGRLQQPVFLAQAYATELLLQQYEGAQSRVIAARKVSVVLSPEAFIYAPDSADITGAVTAELDKAVPSVPVTPPANWQPQQGTAMFLQRFFQIAEQQQQRAAAQGAPPAGQAARPAAPAPTPAAPTTKPVSR
jgi:Skp family chaperone for outer membrane proteins